MFRMTARPGSGEREHRRHCWQWRQFSMASTADGPMFRAIAGGVTAPVWLKLVPLRDDLHRLLQFRWHQLVPGTSVWAAMSARDGPASNVTAHNNLALNTRHVHKRQSAAQPCIDMGVLKRGISPIGTCRKLFPYLCG